MRIKSGWKVNICALETTAHHPEILTTCLYPWRVQTMIMTPTCHLRKLRDDLLDSELQREADRSMAWVARCRPLSCPTDVLNGYRMETGEGESKGGGLDSRPTSYDTLCYY